VTPRSERSMSRYLLIRAAATEWDEEDRIRGDFDVPCSAAGLAELDTRMREIARYNFRQCWVGTDQPADETAQRIAAARGCRLRHHPGLREVRMGLWQGLLRSDVRRKHRRVYAEWLDDPERFCPAGGEPLARVVGRVQGALRDVARKARADELVALVVSPFVGAIVQCTVEGRPLREVLTVRAGAGPLQVVGAPVAATTDSGQNGGTP